MSERDDLEAQERAARSIGDGQAAAKARARIEGIDALRRDYYARMALDGHLTTDTSISLFYRESD